MSGRCNGNADCVKGFECLLNVYRNVGDYGPKCSSGLEGCEKSCGSNSCLTGIEYAVEYTGGPPPCKAALKTTSNTTLTTQQKKSTLFLPIFFACLVVVFFFLCFMMKK